jgi:hypothetical protein
MWKETTVTTEWTNVWGPQPALTLWRIMNFSAIGGNLTTICPCPFRSLVTTLTTLWASKPTNINNDNNNNFLKHIEYVGLTKNILRVGQKAVL